MAFVIAHYFQSYGIGHGEGLECNRKMTQLMNKYLILVSCLAVSQIAMTFLWCLQDLFMLIICELASSTRAVFSLIHSNQNFCTNNNCLHLWVGFMELFFETFKYIFHDWFHMIENNTLQQRYLELLCIMEQYDHSLQTPSLYCRHVTLPTCW